MQVINAIEMGKSDTIMVSVVDPASPLAHKTLTHILQSQKAVGKTSEYIEHIRCNVYDATQAVTTRPPRKGLSSRSLPNFHHCSVLHTFFPFVRTVSHYILLLSPSHCAYFFRSSSCDFRSEYSQVKGPMNTPSFQTRFSTIMWLSSD